MEKNAIITSRLKDLLDVLDARAMVNIFVEDKDGKQTSIAFIKVYELLSNPVLMPKYKNYVVVGFSCGLTTNILIKEEV